MTIETRPPPSDEAAEMLLLGAWVNAPACIPENRCDPSDFHSLDRQAIAAAVLGCLDDRIPIEPATVRLRLVRGHDHDQAERLSAALLECVSVIQHPAHAATHAAIVRNLASVRRLSAALRNAQDALHGPAPNAGEIAADVAEAAARASQGDGQALRGHAKEYLSEAVAEILAPRVDDGSDLRISWGINELDRAGVWIRPGSFPVVAARPGCGKTTFLRRVAFRAARSTGRPVIYLTLEQDPRELVYDEVLAEAGVIDPLGKGLTGEAAEAVTLAADYLQDAGVWLPEDFPQRLPALIPWLHQHIARTKPAMIVIDYLTLIQAPGQTAYERATVTSARLRGVARQTGCPIVVAAQLNRASAGDRREPELHDLRDSGQIEQDATSVILLHYPYAQASREERGKPDALPGELTLMVKKNRRGASFLRVKMDFQADRKRILSRQPGA